MKPAVRRSLAVLALAFATSPVALHASGSPAPTDPPTRRATLLTDITPADIVMQRADSLRARLRFADARVLYLAAAQQQDASRTKPCHALWQVAETYFAEGQLRQAATTLDLVAEKAAGYGDPEAQARALLESAILYEKLGATAQSTARLQRLDAVLTSPYVSNEVRAAIGARRS